MVILMPLKMLEPTIKPFNSHEFRLWQLISPTLPIGAYAYSQALEFAVETGWVSDRSTAYEWMSGQLKATLGRLESPVCMRLFSAFSEPDLAGAVYWNHFLLSSRETSELLLEDQQLGQALTRLLNDLEVELPVAFRGEPIAYLTAFAFAAHSWAIPLHQALPGFLWSWCDNQVSALIKLMPFGQTDGQRLLASLVDAIPGIIDTAELLSDDEIGNTAYGVAMASSMHETQYSRLFRS
mgnify:FL=1